jgi:uncharacterized membrane protein
MRQIAIVFLLAGLALAIAGLVNGSRPLQIVGVALIFLSVCRRLLGRGRSGS